MRLRRDSLPTGYLIAPAAGASNSAALLLLVAGAADIAALQSILELVRPIDKLVGIDVPDQRRLDSLGLGIDPSRILRLEAREFAGLDAVGLGTILRPAIEIILSGSGEIFPSAGGAVGGVAEGIQFLDREDDLQRILAALESGSDVLLRAPRRSGKTSLLRAIERQSYDRFFVHYLDLQRDRTLVATAARLLANMSGQPLRLTMRKVEEIGWMAAFREAIRGGSHEIKRTLFLLDELVLLFEVFSSDETQTIALAAEALQGLQQLHDEVGVQFVIAGSLDLLDYVQQRLGIADLPPMFREALVYPLPPLAASCLDTQLRRLLLGSQLVPENEDLEWLSKHFDIAVPYPAQLFLDKLTHEIRTRGPVGPGGIDTLLTTFLRETDAFREFESHLDRAESSRKQYVVNALDMITAQPFHRGEDIGNVCAVLMSNDHFTWMTETFPLLIANSRVRCGSRLWRRWWRAQAGLEP